MHVQKQVQVTFIALVVGLAAAWGISSLPAPVSAAKTRIAAQFSETVQNPLLVEVTDDPDLTLNQCTPDEYLAIERNAHSRFFTDAKRMNRKILGLQLQDQSEKLDILELMLDGVKPEFLFQYAKDCRDALCVVTSLTSSEEASLRAFNMYKRTGYTVNFAQFSFQGEFPEVSIWTDREIRDIETGLLMLPSSMKKMKTLSYFRRSTKKEGDFTAAYAVQSWYDNPVHGYILMMPGGRNRNQTVHTVIHEFGHQVDFSTPGLSDELSRLNSEKTFSQRTRLSEQKIEKAKAQPNDGFTSGYAKTNATEDFAESFADFVYRPHHANIHIPEKFDFLKERVFAGLDYRKYTIESLQGFDSDLLSKNLMNCLTGMNHISIKENRLILYDHKAMLILDNEKANIEYFNEEKSCLANSPLPISSQNGAKKVCGNLGLQAQARQAIQVWLERLTYGVYDAIIPFVPNVQSSGMPREEMMKQLRIRFQNIEVLKPLNPAAQQAFVDRMISNFKVTSYFYEYKPRPKTAPVMGISALSKKKK